jgi:hypothetical protein
MCAFNAKNSTDPMASFGIKFPAFDTNSTGKDGCECVASNSVNTATFAEGNTTTYPADYGIGCDYHFNNSYPFCTA